MLTIDFYDTFADINKFTKYFKQYLLECSIYTFPRAIISYYNVTLDYYCY